MSHYGPGAASTSSRDLGPPPNGATASRYGRDSGPSAYGGRGGSGAGGNGSRNFQAADNRKLFVASLSYDTTAEVLQRLFASVGKVSDCRIAKDRESGESRGFAFVTMERESDALLALEEFNGHELDGREIKVNMANAEGGSGGRKKEEPAKGHGPGEEVNVTAYKVNKFTMI
jgi:RNA recognition motif-containing protein